MSANDSRGNENPYLRIGVRPFINCCSVRTIYGGSLMLPEVKAAMADASERYVNIYELMEQAGARLSELTGAEWGLVTCGSAAAVCLAAAGAIAGNDPEKMLRLPNTQGMKNRVIIPQGQRFAYDHGIRMVGGTIVEVENQQSLLAEMESGRVAMVCVLSRSEADSAIRIEDIAKEAKPRGIPVLVDAAASEHITRPDPWLGRGANMVVYSGGKFVCGPQATGLLLGDKVNVRAAWANASPHNAFGRPMKVSKEDIIGILTAVEIWFGARDHKSEEKKWQNDLASIAQAVSRVSGVRAEGLEPRSGRIPRLKIIWDRAKVQHTGLDLRQVLLDSEPRIMLDDTEATDVSVQIEPFGLQLGEAQIVGARIAEVLGSAPQTKTGLKRAEGPFNVAGRWELKIGFLGGEATQQLVLEQTGGNLSGAHRTQFNEAAIKGSVEGNRVEFESLHPFEGMRLSYLFEGEANDGGLFGTVKLGAASKFAGPVNAGQYGSANWSAIRVV